MIPPEVRASAASADLRGLPPVIAAMSTELASGHVCAATVSQLAYFHSTEHEPSAIHHALGGRPGAWWTGVQASALPQRLRSSWLDDWIVMMIADAPGDVWAAAAHGESRPSLIREFDQRASALDSQCHAALLAVLEDGLASLLRRAGIQVMSSVKDVKVKDVLAGVSLDELPALARQIQLRPGRTVWAISNIDVQRLIEQAIKDVADKIRKVADTFDRKAVDLYRTVFGTELTILDSARVNDVVASAVETFETLARSQLDPEPGTAPDDDVARERGSSRVGAGVATALLALLTGAGGVRENSGMVAIQQTRVAPSIVKRPALQQQNLRILAEAGRRIAEAKAQVDSTATAYASQIERALTDLRDALAGTRGTARDAVEQLVRDERARLEALRTQRQTALDDARRRALTVAKEAGLTDRAVPIADGLGSGRMELVTRTYWVHAKEGQPSVPFPPHLALDGALVGSETWEQTRVQPLTYTTKSGELRGREPFSLGAWFPGDHAGCSCGFSTETVVRVIPDLESGPGVA